MKALKIHHINMSFWFTDTLCVNFCSSSLFQPFLIPVDNIDLLITIETMMASNKLLLNADVCLLFIITVRDRITDTVIQL